MQAIREIYLVYSNACFNLAFRILGCEAKASDVVQEVFVTLIEKISLYKPNTNFGAWLKKITVNQAIGKIRYDGKFADEDVDSLMSCTDSFSINWLEVSIDLEALLTRLPDNLRAVLWLHEVEGLTHKQIAECFGKSESFAKVNLLRAFRALSELKEVKEAAK